MQKWKKWITLLFPVNNCFSCQRDVIQLWMHRENPRDIGLSQGQLRASWSLTASAARAVRCSSRNSGPTFQCHTINWFTANCFRRNIYHFREERAGFLWIGWISCFPVICSSGPALEALAETMAEHSCDNSSISTVYSLGHETSFLFTSIC